jgi:hypothetical protein
MQNTQNQDCIITDAIENAMPPMCQTSDVLTKVGLAGTDEGTLSQKGERLTEAVEINVRYLDAKFHH